MSEPPEFSRRPPPAESPAADLFELELKLLLDAIYLKYHYDFRSYSRASLRRRLRIAMQRWNCDSLGQLQDKLINQPNVFTGLLNFLTVQVSDMFRDPAYYRVLREQIVPMLRTYPSLKVWVAGCSTGEEAWSIAVLLKEEGLIERSLIYATDINPDALRQAQAGVYDIGRIPGFSENHRLSGAPDSLSRHYTAAYGRAIFDQSLKQRMVFSDHSLATDSVFAEVQLVSCRNVMIYFDRALQARALGLFHESLCRKGYLGLGSKESLRFSAHADDFIELARAERLFQKV